VRSHTTHSRSADKRTIVSVQFERESLEADAPTIQATFEYRYPDSFQLTAASPGILIPLATTRVDTRESVDLTKEERDEVFQLASEYSYRFSTDD